MLMKITKPLSQRSLKTKPTQTIYSLCSALYVESLLLFVFPEMTQRLFFIIFHEIGNVFLLLISSAKVAHQSSC